MNNNILTFESLFSRATPLFYKVWIDEATPEEINYYKEYFRKYPNKGNFTEFYNKVLKKNIKVLFTPWEYETPTSYKTPEEFLQAIQEAEEAEKAI